MTVLYTLSGVQQRYGPRTVLHIPALSIHEGEIFTIVGPSGAGKSTLLRLLALLETPHTGSVTIQLNGHAVPSDIVSMADRRQITMMFQRPVLLSRSVRANIAYGLHLRGKQDIGTHIDEVLERVSLLHVANARPRTLSAGEMQRVAIARALVLQPRILLLDEPTANLDPHNVRLIENLIREQYERYGTTIVLVTHNIFQARRLGTRLGLLLQGEMIEVARTEDFFNSPKDPRTAAFVSGELVY